MSNKANITRASGCVVCDGSIRKLFGTRDYRRPQDTQVYNIVWCDKCEYGWIDAELLPEQVAKFYEVEYYTHTSADAADHRGNVWEALRTHLACRLDRGVAFSPQEVGRTGRLLDIGCGSGHNMAIFKAAGFDVCGIEPDPQARAIAARSGLVFEGTAEAPPEEVGGGYDYALLSHVLEHTISPSKTLQEANERLVTGGKLIVEVPNCRAEGFSLFGPSWPWTDVPRHIHFFTKGSLVQHLRTAGFEPVNIIYTGFTRQFSPAWIKDIELIMSSTKAPDFQRTSSARQSWGLLLKTAFASADRKYDSIRIHATKT